MDILKKIFNGYVAKGGDLSSSLHFKKLKELWNRDSLFDALGVTRREKYHSRMLAWVFDSRTDSRLSIAACNGLFKAIFAHGNQDKLNPIIDVCDAAGVKPGCSIDDVKSEIEVPVDVEYHGTVHKGFVDLILNVTIKDNQTGQKTLRTIIVENKIDSDEHKVGNRDDAPWQTIGYKIWGDAKYDPHPVYVFLAAVGQECESKDYVCLSYQDVLDTIILPSMSQVTDAHRRFCLEEWSKSFCYSLKRTGGNAMATSTEEKDLIRKFWKENHDQIIRMLEIIAEDDGCEKTGADGAMIRQAINRIAGAQFDYYVGDKAVDEATFKDSLIEQKRATIYVHYNDNRPVVTIPWDASNFTATSLVKANLQSKTFWRNDKMVISRVEVKI